jgi:hypothetical protein
MNINLTLEHLRNPYVKQLKINYEPKILFNPVGAIKKNELKNA